MPLTPARSDCQSCSVLCPRGETKPTPVMATARRGAASPLGRSRSASVGAGLGGISAKYQAAVRTAETERVGDHGGYRLAAPLVGDVVQVAHRIGMLVVDRR